MFGAYTEYILVPINRNCHIFSYFFCKSGRTLPLGIKLSAAYQVRQILLTLIVQTMKEQIFTVETENLGCYAKSHDFEVGEFGNNPTSRDISECVD